MKCLLGVWLRRRDLLVGKILTHAFAWQMILYPWGYDYNLPDADDKDELVSEQRGVADTSDAMPPCDKVQFY